MKLSVKREETALCINVSTWVTPPSNDSVYRDQTKKWRKRMKNLIYGYLKDIEVECDYIVDMTLSNTLDIKKKSYLKFEIVILQEGYLPSEKLKKGIRKLIEQYERFSPENINID